MEPPNPVAKEVNVTLRITRESAPELRTTMRLEGDLVSEWAALLEHECSELLRASDVVILDLRGVRFVDRAGVGTLWRLSGAGVQIQCRPGAVASVLEGEGIPVVRVSDVDDYGRN